MLGRPTDSLHSLHGHWLSQHPNFLTPGKQAIQLKLKRKRGKANNQEALRTSHWRRVQTKGKPSLCSQPSLTKKKKLLMVKGTAFEFTQTVV